MADYNKDRWGETFPGTVSNEERPKDGIDNSLSFETDKFPQRIASDPVRYDLENAFGKQLFSNDQRLKDKIDANKKSTDDALDAHKKDPRAHINGIAGNAASATKLQTARKIGGVSFNGTADITLPGVNTKGNQDTSGKAATATKLATPRTISLTGNATGAATFDGTSDVSINVSVSQADSATNADKVDGIHAASMFYDKGGWDADNWATIGAYETNGTPPSSGWAGWGQVISSSTENTRFQLYASDYFKSSGRLHYRTGYGDRKNDWIAILDSENYNLFAPTKTGDGASGTWGIDISGNAASATKATNDSNGANIASTYVKKAGGTTTGKITFESTDLNALPEVKKTSDDNMSGIRFSSKTKFLGAVGKRLSNGEDLLNLRSDNGTTDIVLDSRNYNNYAPTKTGSGASGTWGIDISGNAASATNADKLDGAHLADVYRQVGGHNTPTITSIIDWNTMKACNGGTDVRTINNTTYGVRAYSGNSDFSSGVLKGYERGSFYLTQDYTNFDKLCFLFCSDAGKDIEYTMTDVFLLNYIMTNYSVVNLSHDNDDFWIVTGYSNKGTAKDKVSTKRIFSAPASLEAQNCGIVDVLGIKY